MQFPTNPTNGQLYELTKGITYQYDSPTKTWIRLASNTIILQLASSLKAGAMSSTDLKKLNRLVIPPPQSTIKSDKCSTAYTTGAISLYTGDTFVGVAGTLPIQNKVNDAIVSQNFPFHIHQHTFGFNFTLNLYNLVDELKKRGHYNVTGKQGDKGLKGLTGSTGTKGLPIGPKGAKGAKGTSPPCTLKIEQDTLSAVTVPGLNMGITGLRAVFTSDTEYKLVATRQPLGSSQLSADHFNVKSQQSQWVLAVANAGASSQKLYYIDIGPIIETIHQKFLSEVDRVRIGYEDVVKFWIQTMSDLFDEQKAALCCALEFAVSKTKSTQLRQHIESLAATTVGTARIRLYGRNSSQSVHLSSTRLAPNNECDNGVPFPTTVIPPNSGADAVAQVAQAQAAHAQTVIPSDGIVAQSVGNSFNGLASITVDPLLNAGSIKNAVEVNLPTGDYVATIRSCCPQIDGKHSVPLIIQSVNDGKTVSTKFLDKGSFIVLSDAYNAYNGLSVKFRHDGGTVRLYYPIIPSHNVSGNVVIDITKEVVAPRADDKFICSMSKKTLLKYRDAWDSGKCCGLSIRIGGQDYIIVKRSLSGDDACGGEETMDTPCISKFYNDVGHVAIAWPSFDGISFVPVIMDDILFRYNEALSNEVGKMIVDNKYALPRGSNSGSRFLSFQLGSILFPLA